MVESAELGNTIDKQTYERRHAKLRVELLQAQYDVLRERRFAVLIIIGGVDGAGKGETVAALTEWMDPRHIEVNAFGTASDEERERPPMWRFFRALPPKGKIGIFFGSWYTEPILDRVLGDGTDQGLDNAMAHIRQHEDMLAAEGTLILKFWLHLGKKAQRKRLKELAADKLEAWRVTEEDWRRFKHYDEFRTTSERALGITSSAAAPWTIIEGADARYRQLTVGEAILAALRERFDRRESPNTPVMPLPARRAQPPITRSLDLTRSLAKETYDKKLARLQRELGLQCRDRRFRKLSLVLVFEGLDAAGKGGAIRRVTQALDARFYRVVPIAAPSDEEKAQPYLWRFWRHAPRDGHAVIFDRSWYGRVLVERIEGFCQPADWMRAYAEMNDFEEQLAQAGNILCKFWLHISPDEQLRRFKARQRVCYKRFKITDDDWRNREKTGAYEQAVSDMIERTSTPTAPWTLVEAEDKYYARIKVLRTICDAVAEAMDD